MRQKLSILVVVTVVLAVAALCIGDPNPAYACSSKSATADAACYSAAAKAATTVTASAHECCKTAVSVALASYSNKAKYCSKNASAKTASGYSCSKSAASAASATVETKTLKAACCKETVAAFEAACASYARSALSSVYSCSRSAEAKSATKTAGSYSCSKSASVTLAAIPYREGKRVELAGNVACGSCDLKTTKDCQAVFKTADGKAYLLIENNMVEKMRAKSAACAKTAKAGYKVVTRVRLLDGTKYLEVETIAAL